jgi:hypothetical protein
LTKEFAAKEKLEIVLSAPTDITKTGKKTYIFVGLKEF